MSTCQTSTTEQYVLWMIKKVTTFLIKYFEWSNWHVIIKTTKLHYKESFSRWKGVTLWSSWLYHFKLGGAAVYPCPCRWLARPVWYSWAHSSGWPAAPHQADQSASPAPRLCLLSTSRVFSLFSKLTIETADENTLRTPSILTTITIICLLLFFKKDNMVIKFFYLS